MINRLLITFYSLLKWSEEFCGSLQLMIGGYQSPITFQRHFILIMLCRRIAPMWAGQFWSQLILNVTDLCWEKWITSVAVFLLNFWVTKLILWLYVFVHIYQKQFFFEKPRNFMFFMCFGPRRSFYEKSSGVRRTKLGRWKFQFQIISKPFDRSPSYLVWLCKKIIDI